MTVDDIYDKITKNSEAIGYNHAIADCLKIVVSALQRWQANGMARVAIIEVGDAISLLKKTKTDN